MPVDAIHQASVVGFGDQHTDRYERARPSYPIEAVDRLLSEALQHYTSDHDTDTVNVNIVEIGSGTGKGTRVLLDRLHRYTTTVNTRLTFTLTCVEPVDGMRKKLRELLPTIACIDGSGSDLHTFSDSSVDIIWAAQAFHLFATDSAVNEFHRVLKPATGTVCLIWNTRDRRVPWVDALESVIDTYYSSDVPRQQTGEFRRLFARHSVQFEPLQESHIYDGVLQSGDLELMIDRVMTISVIASLPPDAKAQCAEKLRRAIVDHPDNTGKTIFTLPYETEFYWTRKL